MMPESTATASCGSGANPTTSSSTGTRVGSSSNPRSRRLGTMMGVRIAVPVPPLAVDFIEDFTVGSGSPGPTGAFGPHIMKGSGQVDPVARAVAAVARAAARLDLGDHDRVVGTARGAGGDRVRDGATRVEIAVGAGDDVEVGALAVGELEGRAGDRRAPVDAGV